MSAVRLFQVATIMMASFKVLYFAAEKEKEQKKSYNYDEHWTIVMILKLFFWYLNHLTPAFEIKNT